MLQFQCQTHSNYIIVATSGMSIWEIFVQNLATTRIIFKARTYFSLQSRLGFSEHFNVVYTIQCQNLKVYISTIFCPYKTNRFNERVKGDFPLLVQFPIRYLISVPIKTVQQNGHPIVQNKITIFHYPNHLIPDLTPFSETATNFT